MSLASTAKIAALRTARPVLSALDAGQLRRLRAEAGKDGQAIVEAVEKLNRLDNDSSADLSAIDARRRELLGRPEALADGSMGDPLPWDKDATVADACRDSKKPRPALLLYWLVRQLRPIKIVEFGSNVGISAGYIAAALRANGDGGHLWTLDGSHYRQRLAKETIEKLGFADTVSFAFGEFNDILPTVLAENGPFDCAFIDGNHTLEPTMDFTRQVLEQADRDPLMIYDDIRWSPQMKEAWRQLRQDPRMTTAADLYSVGVCRISRDASASRCITRPMLSVLYGPEPSLTA